jgi:CubicO group peptidase (beta-lactamase class C family)
MLTFQNPRRRAGVTLPMLFTHTSGLQGMEDFDAERTPELTWTVESEAALSLPPEISPGTRLAYSDVNYVLLAMVVERLTDQPFAAACRELVLDPLGMEGFFAERGGMRAVADDGASDGDRSDRTILGKAPVTICMP